MTEPKLEVREDPPSEDAIKAQLAEMGVKDLQEGGRVVEPQRADTLPEAETSQVEPETAESIIPDKFKDKSKEDVIQAYLELEKLNQKQGVERLNPEPEKPSGLEGVNWNEFADEWTQTQELSDESRKKITELGIPEGIVDQYVRGLAATRDQQVTEIMGYVGGEANYQEMHSWMQANLPDNEKEAFLNAVSTGSDMGVIEMAMKGMYARYQASPQGNTSQLTGRPDGANPVAPYRTRSDAEAAQADKRYLQDPQYTQDVNERIMRMDPKLFSIGSGS